MQALPLPASRTTRAEEEVQLREVWSVLKRNRFLILGCLVLAITLAVVYTLRATPTYEASASIQVDERRSDVPVLDILRKLSSGSEVTTEMQVLQSRTLVEDVVDSLSLQVLLEKPRRTRRAKVLHFVKASRDASNAEYRFERQSGGRFAVYKRSTGVRLGAFAPGDRIQLDGAVVVLTPTATEHPEIRLHVGAFEAAVDAVRSGIRVGRPSRDANILIARYRGTDPDVVREVPNVLAERFIARRVGVQKTEARSTVRFLREQLDTLSLQLKEGEDELRSFRQSERIVSLPDEASAQVRRLAEMQAERNSIDAERGALAALLAEVRDSAARQQPNKASPYRRLIAFPTLLRNPATSEMLRALAAVENQRTELLTRRTSEDPDVQTLSARVRELEEQLQSIGVTYLQGLTNQVVSLDAMLARFGEQLQRIPEREVQYARLQRRPKVLEEIFTLMQTRLKEAEILQAVEDPSVRVVDAAITPGSPVSPRKALAIMLSALVGLVVGTAGAFLREYMDRSVHTREDVQLVAGIPVLGLIPQIDDEIANVRLRDGARARAGLAGAAFPASATPHAGGRATGEISRHALTPISPNLRSVGPRLITGIDPRNPVSEAYRTLRTNITFARPDQPVKTLVFTSPMPGDGKTTSAANMAITLAQQGHKVLLVDADMRRGILNRAFETSRAPGLSNVLLGVVTLDRAIRKINLRESGTLHFLGTGTLPPNPAELLGSARMRALLELVEKDYDVVILDSPPLNVVTDAAVLGTSADGVLLVARAGTTPSEAIAYAMEQLRNVRAPVLGAVLNDVDVSRETSYYGFVRYGFYEE